MREFFTLFLFVVAIVMVSVAVLITLGATAELVECRSFSKKYSLETEWRPLSGCVVEPRGAAFLLSTIDDSE